MQFLNRLERLGNQFSKSQLRKRRDLSRRNRRSRLAMELLEKRHLLAANFSVNEAGDELKINVQSSDASVYLRTRPGEYLLEYKTDPNDGWSDTFDDKTVSLDKDFTILVGTGQNSSVDLKDASDAVVYLAGIETPGTHLDVTSSIDLSVVGDIVLEEGSLNLEIADTTNIFGGTVGHKSSKLTIGPVNPEANEDADFFADDHLTIHAGEIELVTEQISQKSTKQVFAQDNIRSEIVIQDAVIHGESVTIEAVSEDLSIGSYPAAYKSDWTPNYGGPDGQALLTALPSTLFGFLTGGGLPGGVAIREASSVLTIEGSTIEAAGDIVIESKNETEAKVKAIAAKPGWADNQGGGILRVKPETSTSRGWDALNTLSVGVAIATGVSDLSIKNESLIRSEFGSVNVLSEGTVASEVAARTTQNISKNGPANQFGAGGSISLTFSDADITSTLDATSSIIAAGNVNFEANGEVINEGDASSVTYYDGTGALVFAFGTDSTDVHATVDGTIAAQGAPIQSQTFEASDIDTTTNTITIANHGFVDGQLLDLQSDADPVPEISEDIVGILPGDEVRVHVVDPDTIQLYLVQPLELESPEGDTEAIQTLSTYQTIAFDPQTQNFAPGVNALVLSADKGVLIVGDTPDTDQPIVSNPLVTGQAVEYQMEVFVTDAEGNPIDSEPVDGLFDGTTYYAIVDPENPSQIRLAVNERDALDGIGVEMTGPGVGTRHFLSYVSEHKEFSPYTDLDSETGVIHMDTTGIQTGDPLLYDPDPSIEFKRLIDRTAVFNADGRSIDFDAPGTIDFGQPVLDSSVFVMTIPDHGFEHGERVRYSTANQDGEDSAAILVGDHDELLAGQEYVIIRVDQWSIQLANPDTPDVAIELVDASESGTQQLVSVDSGRAVYFDPGGTVQWNAVDTGNNSILFNEAHRLLDGQRVVYQADANSGGQGNQSVGGLVSGDSYYVIVVSEFEIQLSRSSDTDWNRNLFTNYVSLADGAVELTSGATGSAESLHRFVVQNTDIEEDWIVSENHELWTGQAFTYELKTGPAIGGLVEGQTYYAVRLDSNRFRVADSLENASLAAGGSEGWVDLLNVGESNTNQAVRYETFVYQFEADRSSPVVDTVANTIEVIDHGMISGQQVNYQTSGGEPIGGLADAETYDVIVIDADHFQLSPVEGFTYANTAALPGQTIELSEGATLGTGMHVFRVIQDVEIANRTDPIFVFNPLEVPPVDIDADRIRVQGLSVSTGDPVRYLTGGGTAIGGLENGQTYFAIRIEDPAGEPTSWIQLAATEADALAGNYVDFTAAGTGSEHGMEVDSTVSVFDLEIEGLDFGMTYYAVVQGPNSLRLTESPPAAYQAQAQPLDSLIEAGAAPYSLSTTEGITVEGIRISAELEAETAKTAGALVGHHPTLADYVTRPEVAVRHYQNQKLGHSAPTHNSAAGKGEEGHYNWNFLASVAWNAISEHNVTATVGQSDTHEAILISHHDVVIEAVIDQKIETHALANSMPESGKKFIIATAFAYTDANNRAEAIIGSHARIDAGGELELKSVVEYPRLVDWKDLIPFQGNCVDGDSDTACTPFYTLLKGYSQIAGEEMFGFAELLNTWAQSQAFQAQSGTTLTDVLGNEIGKLDENRFEFAFTFSVGAATYNNYSNAVIESGAEINQGISLVDLPTVATFEESILKVVADTDLLLVGLAGMIHLNFSIDGFTESFHHRKSNFNSVGNVFSLTGNKSGTAGLGLSLIEQLMTNHTVAMIESGAIVTTGQEHGEGVVVEARTADKTFNFTQSGVDSEGFGIAASQGATVEDSYTVAIVETGATIESEGALDITAENDALHSVGAGGIAFGDTLGLGLSASTVVMDRQTGAFLGELHEGWDNPTDFIVSRSTNANLYTAEESEISVADLVVESENLGQLTTVSVVGAISNGGNRATGSFSKSENLVWAGSRNHLGISGDAAVNVVTDETLANIDLSGELSVHEAVEVAARNSTDFLTIAGATAISWNGSGSETAAVAMTAAVAVNDLDLTTVATVGGETSIPVGHDEGEWHMGSLAIETASHGDVLAVAVALGISQLNKPEFALNAAFSWASNPMIDRSHSYLEPLQHGSYRIEGEHAIDLELSSINDRSINASSGAAAFSFGSATVGVGIGVSPAVNDITIETLANIQPGVSLWTDAIEIQALQQADIEAWSMAGSGEFPSTPSLGFGVTAVDVQTVGSIAINRLTSNSRATVGLDPEQGGTGRVTLHDVGEITAESKNQSDIKAIAGEGFIAIHQSGAEVSVAVGLAFGLNEISEDSFSEAMLVGVDILEARGDIKLVSEFAPSLKSVSVAVSLGVIFGSTGLTAASVDGVGAFAVNSVGAIDNKRDHKGKRTAVGIRNESGIRHSFIEVAEDALGILYDVGIDAIATAFEREGDDEYNEISVISQVHDIDLSVALNPTFGSASVGISYTANLIAVDSHATISDSVILEASSVIVDATSAGGIRSVGTSSSLNVSTNTNVSLGFLGTFVINVLEGETKAFIEGGQIELAQIDMTEDQLQIHAVDESSISALAVAGQFGVTVDQAGLAVSVEIPYSTSRNWIDNEIYAGVVAKNDAVSEVVESEQAIVELHGNASILALDESLLESQNDSVAVDVSASAEVGVALNAASAISDNTVTNNVTSEVAGTELTIASGDLSVIAESVPQHAAETFALDIAGSGGYVAVSIGVAVSKATNTIDGDLSASIGRQDAGETALSVGGAIDVLAELKQHTVNGQPQASAYANAPSIAAALAIGIGGSGSGAGSAAESQSHLDVSASVGHAEIRSDGGITVFARDETSLETDTSAISAAAGLGGLSVAVSKSLVVNQNDVSAVISDSSVTSDLQDVVVNALGSSELTPHATTVAVTVAIGVSDTTTNIDAIYRGDETCDDEDECGASVHAGITEGSQVNAPLGGILVDAISDAEVTATAISGSVAVVAVDVVSQKVWASPAVTASIEGSSLNAAKVIANSLTNDTASTKMIGGDGGGLSINVANIYSEAKPVVRTEVGDMANIEGVTQVVVRAESISDARALLGPEEENSDDRQKEINAGLVTVSASDSFATVAPIVDVNVGNASVHSDGEILIEAVGGRLMERPDASVFNANTGIDANADGLDANTIEFNEEHGLGYGDAIQYVASDTSNANPVGGLTPGEIYRAIPRDATIIRLGSVLVTGTELSVYQSDIPITWHQADGLAEAVGGRLASLTSEAENNDVLSLLPEGHEAWIGGTDQIQDGTWTWELPGSDGVVFWIDGQTVDAYSDWAEGAPDRSLSELNFAAIENTAKHTAGTWVTKSNEEKLNYYVVAAPNSDAVNLLNDELQFKNPHYLYGAQPNDGGEFGEDALAIAASGYWFDLQTMDELPAYIYKDASTGGFKFAAATGETGWTFREAVEDAKNLDRVLAQPASKTQNDEIKALMIDNGINQAWLGGNDFEQEGTWVWNNTGDVFWQGGLYGQSVNGAFTNFADATQVIYDAGVIPIGGLVDGETYLVRETDLSENVLKLEHPDALPVAPVDFDGTAVIDNDSSGNSVLNINAHGFAHGQVVTYRTAKPLQFNALDVDDNSKTVTPHDENATFDISNPDQYTELLTDGQQVVYAANANNSQWYWLPNDYEETSDQPFWPQGSATQADPPYANWNPNAPTSVDTQFSAVMVDDGTWKNYSGTDSISGYLLERPQFQVSPRVSKGNNFNGAIDAWIGVWPATIISENEWATARDAIGEEDVYLGGSDAKDRSHWYWTDLSPDEESGKEFWDGKSKGDEKNGYQSFWADGEPNDTGMINKETQLLMYASSGKWNDVKNDQTHPWLVESKQFTYIPFSGTYEEARADAESQGGWLATIRSAEENADALAALEAASKGMLLWIGATNEQSQADWMWVGSETAPDGTPLAEPVEVVLTYTNWYPNEPNNYNGDENYIQMYADPAYKGQWNDINGATPLGGYLLEKNGDFELIEDTFTWNEAFQDAKARGGQLATIDSSSDQQLAESKLGSSSVWIGGTDEGHEGNFKWVEMVGYQNWAPTEPSLNNEHYAHLRSDGTWNDRSATSELSGYLLETESDYSIVTGTFTWAEAKEDAETRGGHLAIIDSAAKQEAAQSVARRFAWIGATANQLIDGLDAGEAYYASQAVGDNYQLSSTANGAPIAISGQNKSSAVNHYLIPADQQPIEGLHEGQSYYVIKESDNSFRLAATLEDWSTGTSIDLSGTDTAGNGYSGMIGVGSTLGTEGVDLTDAGQGRHKLIVDLTENGLGDQSFAFVSHGWRPPFDLELNHGEAKAITGGGGGGLVGVGVPRALAVSEPDVGVNIEVGARLQGESVYVNSRTHANANSSVDNTFVGIFVESGNSTASTQASEKSQIEISGSIHAEFDLQINASNNDYLTSEAITEGGGAIPLQNSWSRVTHQYTTEVLMDDFARLSAGNQIKIEAHSTFDDEMVSKAKAGGIGGEMKANTAGDDDSKLVNDRKNLGVRIGTEAARSTTSIDLAASYLNARSIMLDAAVMDATASAYSEVRGAGLMTKKATATTRFYDDTKITIGDNSVLHASDDLTISANHRDIDLHSHANFFRKGGLGWFSLRTQTWVDTQSRIEADEDVEIFANSLNLIATHQDVDPQTRLTYGRVEYSDAYDFASSDYTDLPSDSSRNDSGSDSKAFNTLNDINFNATVHFQDRRYLRIDADGMVTNAEGITLADGSLQPGHQYQAGDVIVVDQINYQNSGSQFDSLNYVVNADTVADKHDYSLTDSSTSRLRGTSTLASVSSVTMVNNSLFPMEVQGIDLAPREGNQAGLADSLTLKPDDGSINTDQWAPGTETDSGQSLGLFRLENTNSDGSDLIISGDIDAGLGQIHLVTLGGNLLAGSARTPVTHLRAAAIILDAPSGDVIGNPDGAADPFTLEFLERPTYPDRVLRRDPDAYWRLGETSGLEAVDQSNKDHNGTYGSDVELKQTGALVGGNTSVRFTGSTDSYVEGADFTPTGLDGQTVSGWFMVETTDFDWQAVYFMGDPGTGPTDYTNGGENRENTFWVGRDGFLHWAIGLQDQAAQYEVTTDAGIVIPGRWYHFATVLDAANGQMQLMLDGKLVKSRSDLPTSSKVRSESGNWLLANSPSKESGYHGRLDEVAIINRALTQGEVSGLYLAFGPAADAQWRMNDASTVRMEDRTVNQIDGRYFNVENAVNASPQGLENAAYLDGGQETYVAVGQNDILDSDFAQTITAWIKVEAFSDNNPYAVFVKQPTDDPAEASTGSLSLYVDSSGTLNLFVPLADGTNTLLNSDAGLIDTEGWHQVTAVIDTIEQTVGIFVDGLLSIEATLTGSDSSNTLVIPDGEWRLGNDFSGQSGFRGWMWNVSIRDEPLRPFAIATQYGLIFRRPNILQPRNVRARGDVDLQIKALVNDDREESSTRFNLIETDGNVDLVLLTPDLIGEQSLSTGDYVYSLESIVAGGNLWITSEQATSLADAVGLEAHFQLTNRPTSNLRIDISGSVLANDDSPRVVGDELLNAGITSDFGNIVLSSAADIRIEDQLKTGQDSYFTWGGSGQILGKGQADSDDLIAGALLLGASGGLGMPGEPLRTNVTRIVGSQPTGPVHVYNDSDSLTIGNLIVDRGDLELVNSHQVLVNQEVSVIGGGDIVIAANDQSTSNLLRAASQTFQRQVRFTYSNWSDGEPNNANGNQNYLQMYAIAGYEGKWDDLDGNTALAGYLLELNGEYKLVKGSFTWHQAINNAQSLGGQLATIHSQEDQNRAEALLEGFNIWLGGTDQGHEGDWKWVTLSHYQNWALNQPDNNNGTEHYAHLRTDGTWNDLPGDSLIDGYLLEIDGVYSAITFDDKISWFDANRDAKRRGGQLATIGSEKEQLRAQGLANNKQLWIGATDIQNPGNWLWLEQESLVVGAGVSTSGGDGDILLSGHSGIVVQSDLRLIQYEKPFLLNQNQYDNW
ncbi:MAG: lectin-like protein, partial [Rubripirellula sp.]|nr:lectin-like protein [Rubripirellula sp.]